MHHEYRKHLTKSYKKKQCCPNETNIQKYKEAKTEYARLCRNAQNKSWNKFKAKPEDIKEMNTLRKIFEGSCLAFLGTLEKPVGTLTEPGLPTLNFLLKSHFPSEGEIRNHQYNYDKQVSLTEIQNTDIDWITPELISTVFHQFKSKKSPGTDGIKPIAYKPLPNNIIKYLQIIYKAIIILAYTPRIWKEARLIFIPKPGKNSYKLAKAWRPISLTNYLIKALEKLSVWEADKALMKNPVHTKQHVFRSDRNTVTAISEVTDLIEQHIFFNKHVLSEFLDIQAAFDTISPGKIRSSLQEHGINPLIVKGYYNYITERHLFLKINKTKLSTMVGTGFPQGGVCSAKFWIIAYNQALKILNSHGVTGYGFADDSCTLVGGTKLNQMMSKTQKVVNDLISWEQTCGLKFNPEKTVCITFTQAKSISEYPNKLIVNGKE